MSIPKAFISYSHDSQEHKKWVLDLATRLRNSGVDASLDQWDLGPGSDLPSFMERHLALADRVIMVCSEKYVEKANSGAGGVGYEKMIITADLLKSIDSNKVIPVIRQQGTHSVPVFLRSKMFVDFSLDENFEFSFDELCRSLHDAPLFVKPEVGSNPFKSLDQTPVERRGDEVLEIMRVVIDIFEQGINDFISYKLIVSRVNISRIMLDIVLAKTCDQGLLRKTPNGNFYLSEKGKMYAVNNKIVK